MHNCDSKSMYKSTCQPTYSLYAVNASGNLTAVMFASPYGSEPLAACVHSA